MELILAIETSCDETAVALIRYDNHEEDVVSVVAELVSSQIESHIPYGGVVPEVAAREHLAVLPILTKQLFKQANVTLNEVTKIAVTRGPGLKGCLLIGHCFAQGLSVANKIPLFEINHIEGHVFSPFITDGRLPDEKNYPFLSVIVSGGHTEILEVRGFRNYVLHAVTLDDAVGEAFDKSAQLLGFPYPGGALLAQLADTTRQSRFTLPLVMKGKSNFSFSGLKTAIVRLCKEHLNDETRGEIAFAVQKALIDALCSKIDQVASATDIKTIALGGGVAANQCLRASIKSKGYHCLFPELRYAVDNAVMIGAVAALMVKHSVSVTQECRGVIARWPVVSLTEKAKKTL